MALRSRDYVHWKLHTEISIEKNICENIYLIKTSEKTNNQTILSDTYKGPVMFEDMAAVYPFTENLLTLNKLYAKVILAPNDKALGKKIGKKILDPRIDIVNYTSLPEYNGTKLMGAYSIDADGIKPEAEIPLIEKGILKQILNRATPTEHAMHSTGSARFTNNPDRKSVV